MTQAFNLSQLANKVNTSGQLDVATGSTGTLAVGNGGTGQTTYTNGQLLIGNSTGNTLTKATITAGTGISVTNGAGSITIANTSAGGNLQMQVFTSPGTWTAPASTTTARVTIFGGGGGGAGGQSSIPSRTGGNGGAGGIATVLVTGLSGSYPITIGSGGAASSSGGTSSFSSLISATGGGGGAPNVSHGSPGTITISSGTAIRNNSAMSNFTPAPFPSNSSWFNNGGQFAQGWANTTGGTSAIAYSTTGNYGAGAFGIGNQSSGNGGVGGAVIVEFIG
jgi:hypothetical protein